MKKHESPKEPPDAVRTAPIKRLKNLLTLGNLWLYILSLVKANRGVHAYALDEQIEREFYFRPSKVMIYIVLYKLENEGLIESEYEERRRVYRMTARGEETLKLAREYFELLAKKL